MTKNFSDRIGFMQGRLSPLVDGKIQAFPWDHWQSEFALAKDIGIGLMEWTLDQFQLESNPLMTESGQVEIKKLIKNYNVSIPSLTGDCFMQAPFFKSKGRVKEGLLDDLAKIITACGNLNIEYIVFPIVDDGRIENNLQEKDLLSGLNSMINLLRKNNVKICFESDFPPVELSRLITKFDPQYFGINYDIGNSASLGFDPQDEIRQYARYIMNVHIKDRLLGGTTVPLGKGNSDFPLVMKELLKAGYSGNYILQTARAEDNDHQGVLTKYHNMTVNWLKSKSAGK